MVIQKLPTTGVITGITDPRGSPLIIIPMTSFQQYVTNCGSCSSHACTITKAEDGDEVRTSEDYPYEYVVVNTMDDYSLAKQCDKK